MAKLTYLWGTMNSGKTAQLLTTAYSYKESGKHAILLTPSIDNRDGVGVISSRIGLSEPATPLWEGERLAYPEINGISDKIKTGDIKADVIIVDEGQFLTPEQIDDLAYVANTYTPVLVYGLKTTFKGELFDGSKRLLEQADKVIEIKSVCHYCTDKATQNVRMVGGKVVSDGETVSIGGNESYTSVCWKHWNNLNETAYAKGE